MKRIYVDHQDYGKALQYAVAAACAEANAGRGTYSKIVFLTVNNNHKETTEDTLESYPVQKNCATSRIVNCNTNFIVTTLHRYKQGLCGPHDIVIYCGLQSDEIMPVEDNSGIDLTIAVKEFRSIDLWGGTWGVDGLHANGLSLAQYPLAVPSLKVQNVIRALTHAINLSNYHVFNTSDDDLVKAYARTLKKYEPQTIDPDDVVAFAIRECRWRYELAVLMASYFDKLNHGVKFRGGMRSVDEMKRWYSLW